MKKVLFFAITMLGLLFVSCNKDDARDAYVGVYDGKISARGTKVVDDGDPQPVTENRNGVFTISKDGKRGKKVTVKITGVDYGSFTGSVDGNILTVDEVHVSFVNSGKLTNADIVIQPAQIADNHLILNGSLHTLTTSVTSPFTKEEITSALLIEADKQ